jgi:CubicO group peptidase (beta-lactamase class C family)
MIGRREWLCGTAATGLAAWLGAGLGGSARAQSPAKRKGKTMTRTVRRPALPSSKSATPAGPIRADERMNQTLAPIRDAHHLPGMIGAILLGESLATIGAVGVRKIGSAEPMQVLDQVHLGSCGKAMTATMIGMLVDDGLLTWSSKVADVFPGMASRFHRDFQSVTLSDLLTHRAGLPHDAAWWNLPGVTTTDQRRAALGSLLGNAPLSRPGTTYAYSNAGYALAGLMAEQVSGLSWEELMRERLFGPLEMTTAGFGSPGRDNFASSTSRVDQPWGHRENHGRVEATRQDNAPCMGPAGTIHCSVPDWAKFAALHLRAGRGKTRLLKPATLQTLHTPPAGQDYAGGWLVLDRSWAGGKALNHNGSNTCWYVSIWIAPAREFATMVATNEGGNTAEAACEDATIELIKAVDYLRRGRVGGG